MSLVSVVQQNESVIHIHMPTHFWIHVCFSGGTCGKKPACQCRRHESQVLFLGWEDPLEEGMAIHSSILAWRIPRTEESGGLQSIGSHRVGHD